MRASKASGANQANGKVNNAGQVSRVRAWGLVMAGAVPFWAAVGYLDPLAAFQPAEPPPPVVEPALVLPVAPLKLRLPCQRRQELRLQSFPDCAVRPSRPLPSFGFGPGDYPLGHPGVAVPDGLGRWAPRNGT